MVLNDDAIEGPCLQHESDGVGKVEISEAAKPRSAASARLVPSRSAEMNSNCSVDERVTVHIQTGPRHQHGFRPGRITDVRHRPRDWQ